MGLPLRSPVAKPSCEAATEENAKRRSFMPRTQVTGKANFSPGITSGLPVIRTQALNVAYLGQSIPNRVIETYRVYFSPPNSGVSCKESSGISRIYDGAYLS